MLNVKDTNIGLGPLSYHLPGRKQAIASFQKEKPPAFSQEQMLEYWPEQIIEPENTFHHMSREIAEADAQTPQLEPMGDGTGLTTFSISDQTSCDLAIEAGRRLLQAQQGATPPQTIIYYSSTISTRTAWSTPCRLQYELKLKNATAFAVNQQGGTTHFAALRVATEMLLAEDEIQNVMLVGSECFAPPFRRQYSNLVFAGDSASAMMVSRSRFEFRLLTLRFRDYGACTVLPKADANALTEQFAAKASELMSELLATSGLKPTEIHYLIPPNWSLVLLFKIGQSLGLKPAQIYTDALHELGSLATSDLAVNLKHAQCHGKLRPGDLILGLGLSSGMSIACGLFRYEPER